MQYKKCKACEVSFKPRKQCFLSRSFDSEHLLGHARQLERELTAALSQRDEAIAKKSKYAREVQELADLIIGGVAVPAPYREIKSKLESLISDRDEARRLLSEARNALSGFVHPLEEKDDHLHAITQAESAIKQITEYLK